jgi:hypothetical protein
VFWAAVFWAAVFWAPGGGAEADIGGKHSPGRAGKIPYREYIFDNPS